MSSLKSKIENSRKDYQAGQLTEQEVAKNPFDQFQSWMDEALHNAEIKEPTAMVLATVDARNRPSARIVLLRGFSENGFHFFTNYNSKKGQELAQNPYAALTFFWEPLERQIRIEGKVERISAEMSDNYFFSRPRGNRLGAWSSPQSQIIKDRQELEQIVAVFEARYGNDTPIPRPDFWGGYALIPDCIEFWQGRTNRLHDRLQFKLENGEWKLARLAP